jgi:peptidoglycan/LPS O-acetylase OafA/YrhL
LASQKILHEPLVRSEVKVVTLMRGFAATSVFLFHLVCLSNGYIANQVLNHIFYYGQFGVQFFFVISGFVIPYSMINSGYRTRDFFVFLKKRIIRIEPPYLLVLLLTIVFLWARARSGMARGDLSVPGWKQILLHIGYLIPFTNYRWLSIVFWTLAIEFQFYLSFSLLFDFILKNSILRWLITGLFIGSFFLTLGDAGTFFHWAPVFLLGIYLAFEKKRIIRKKEFWLVVAAMALLIFWKLGWVVGVFSGSAFLCIYLDPQVKSSLLKFLGRISYSLYLLHPLVAFAVINLGIRFTRNFPEKIFFVSAAAGLTILVSFGLYYYVERPCQKLAVSIKYKA